MNQHSLDEEGREEDKEKEEPIAAGMDEGGGEGKLVKSEEPYERLHCKKCNFVISAKIKHRKNCECCPVSLLIVR